MPYVIKGKSTAGNKQLYLMVEPRISNSCGAWSANLKKAVTFANQKLALAAAGKLNVCNAGVVEFMLPPDEEEGKVAKQVVIMSNITKEYLQSLPIARSVERWSFNMERWSFNKGTAMRFDSTEEAQGLASEFLIGKSAQIAAMDIDYVQVGAKAETKPQTGDLSYIIKCGRSGTYFKEHKTCGKAEEWSMHKIYARRFKTPLEAGRAIVKMDGNTKSFKIEEVNIKSVKAKEAFARKGKKDIPAVEERQNFSIRIEHPPNTLIKQLYSNLTVVEAVATVFKEIKRLKKPLECASISPANRQSSESGVRFEKSM